MLQVALFKVLGPVLIGRQVRARAGLGLGYILIHLKPRAQHRRLVTGASHAVPSKALKQH